MNLGASLLGAVPALAVMAYVDRLDAKRPEPRWSLRRVALAGAVAVLPCAVIEYFSLVHINFPSTVATILFQAFICAAMLEELAKLLCVRWFIWNRPEFDERMDGIVYATRAGLGFALVENVLYLWLLAPTAGRFVGMFIGRALLAVPGHAVFAGFMGYAAARRRFDGAGPGLWGGYAIAVLLHGAYDASVFALPLAMEHNRALIAPLAALPILVVGGGALVLRRLAQRAVALDDLAALRVA